MRILTLVDAIADHLQLDAGQEAEIDDLKEIATPDYVLHEMEAVKTTRKEIQILE